MVPSVKLLPVILIVAIDIHQHDHNLHHYHNNRISIYEYGIRHCYRWWNCLWMLCSRDCICVLGIASESSSIVGRSGSMTTSNTFTAGSVYNYDEIADEIFRLRELCQQTTVDTAARDEQIKRINDLQDYITQQTAHLTEFDESLVRRWVKQITIWDNCITVELKSGVSIDVDA
ncbi:MAG: hypothetical protein LUD54_01150 [Oscillospiraceae bacterium]|nr:hypothetical protein [Oscillospiraceae bacterium]